jgi:ribosomal protein L14E/L6E/L27E
MVKKNVTCRNKEIAPGVNKHGRSKQWHPKGGWAAVNKKQAKKVVVKAKVSQKWYPAEDVKTPLPNRKKARACKVKVNCTPGSIVIVLAGRFKGKRVIVLKQLDSGLLLVTGPFKVNGVPLRRMNQAYVIGTSTKVDVSKVRLALFSSPPQLPSFPFALPLVFTCTHAHPSRRGRSCYDRNILITFQIFNLSASARCLTEPVVLSSSFPSPPHCTHTTHAPTFLQCKIIFRRAHLSTQLSLQQQADVSGIDDKFFEVAEKAKKARFFDNDGVDAASTGPSAERKAAQKQVDAAITKAVEAIPQLKHYLNAKFTLTKGQHPHNMQF